MRKTILFIACLLMTATAGFAQTQQGQTEYQDTVRASPPKEKGSFLLQLLDFAIERELNAEVEYEKCTYCDGRGRYNSGIHCSRCDGKGRIKKKTYKE